MVRDDWDDAAAVKVSPRKRLSAVVSVRFTPDEEELLREFAEAHDLTLSKLVRDAALQRCAIDGPSFRHPVSQRSQGTSGYSEEPPRLAVGPDATVSHSMTPPMRVRASSSQRR